MVTGHSFLFLPDISGFTNFVNHTEALHSRHIIAELLELIIDQNELDLSLAEIEGDALFFYAHNRVPSAQQLFRQVEKMYKTFHAHVRLYDTRRICHCGACSSASSLDLKFIAHAGPLEFITVKDQTKPYGPEVISAHRLMKNDVDSDGYLLLSDSLINNWQDRIEADQLGLHARQGESSYDFGKVRYEYFLLDKFQEGVDEPEVRKQVSRIKNPIQLREKINRPRHELFELISNFDYRLLWQFGINDLTYEADRVNREGTKHQCIINGNQIELETIRGDFGPENLVYGEKADNPPLPFIKELTTYFILKESENETDLTLEAHVHFTPGLGKLAAPILKSVMKRQLKGGIQKLKSAAENGAFEAALNEVADLVEAGPLQAG